MDRVQIGAAVHRIDNANAGDPEAAHGVVDDVLYELAPPEVQAAVDQLRSRCEWWATA